MLRTFLRLYALYRRRHRAVPLHPRPLEAAGEQIGYLDRAWEQNGRLIVEGWVRAESVALRVGPRVVAIDHRPERKDVPPSFNARGFRGSAGAGPGRVALRLGHVDGYTDVPLGRARLRQRLTAEARVLRGFAVDGARALPAALAWARGCSLADRARVRAALRLDEGPGLRMLDPGIFEPPSPEEATRVTVIVPVFNACALAEESLHRLAAHTGIDWCVIVIDDASPDPEVWPMLNAWADAQGGRLTLLRNETNLGFLGTVNRALALAGTADPVVLLNTDAMLPEGWASRLLSPLADPSIASVTPLSNDAEICTVPQPGHPVRLGPGEAEAIDCTAARLGGPLAEVPTGVGFCMALSPRWLARVPGFDPIFGKGYGEEVDWCQRTRALGGRHVVQHRLFVEHRASASFGTGARAARVAEASRIVAARYPRFDAEVQEFIARDPLATARAALTLARLGAGGREVPLFLAHSMGGGAEMVLRRTLTQAGPALVLRVGGPLRWRLEIHQGDRVQALSSADFGPIGRLLGALRLRVVYSCGVGDPDPVALPGYLLDLAGEGRLEVEVHDYFILSPSVFLTGPSGRYQGVPDPAAPGPQDSMQRPDGRAASLAEWQEAWGRLVGRADVVRVFSHDSARLIGRAYPSARGRITVEPHAPMVTPPRILPPTGRRVVGVLGNISAPKGAGLLCELARAAQGGPVEIVLLGALDPAFTPPPRLRVLGGYSLDQIAPLARRHQVGAWLIPSTCPETFSFATHEALATGLPVVGLGLGAQGEALAAHPNGHPVPLEDGRPPVAALLAALEAAIAEEGPEALTRVA